MVSLLDSHPEIRCELEIFNKKRPSIDDFLSHKVEQSPKPVYGFKVAHYQLDEIQQINPHHFLVDLHQQGWKIIHLQRRNILRQALSELIARYRGGKWHDETENPLARQKIPINCQDLLQKIDDVKWTVRQEKEFLQALPHLPLIYEDHLLPPDQHQTTADTVASFLGLSSAPVNSSLARTTSDNLADFIENYDELVQVVRQSDYAHLLDGAQPISVTVPNIVPASSAIDKKKFVIFFDIRSGSQLLASLLDSHPDIQCDMEILNKKHLSVDDVLCNRLKQTVESVYGFKVTHQQLDKFQQINPRDFLMSLHQQGWKIIHLQRRNILRQAISEMIAYYRGGQWHDETENPLAQQKIPIDCQDLLRRMKEIRWTAKQAVQIFEWVPHLPLIYEDHLLPSDQHQATADTIASFLEIPSAAVTSNYTRTTSDNLADFIENYEEMCMWLDKAIMPIF